MAKNFPLSTIWRLLILMRLLAAILLLVPSLVCANTSHPGNFEVVRESAPSPASLYDYTYVETPEGNRYLILTYRRDMFILRINLQSGEVTRYDTPGCGYGLVATREGRVFLGTSLSPGAKLFEYHVEENRLEEIATIENEQALYWLAEAPDGQIYGGTYPNTLLIRFNPAIGQVTNLGPQYSGQTHNLYGAVSPSGKVYSGIGMKTQALIEYDPATGTTRNLWPTEWETTNLPRVYLGEDDHVYAYPGIPTESSEGKTLSIDPQGNVGITTRSVRQAMGCSPRSRVARPILPDGTIVQQVQVEQITLIDPDGSERVLAFTADAGQKDVYSVGNGPGGTIYATSKPFIIFGYDPRSEQMIDMPRSSMPGRGQGGQVDSLSHSAGKLILGTYTHARLFKMELTPDFIETTELGPIHESQDRIHTLLPFDEQHLYVGSISGYGKKGGALSLLNTETGERQVFLDALPDQSIVMLAFDSHKDLLYLGGSVYGGTGTFHEEQQTHSALLGEWDTHTNTLLRTVAIPGEPKISGLVVLPEVICGITLTGKWFVVKRDNFQLLTLHDLGWGSPPQLSRLTHHAETGRIHGVAGRQIFQVHSSHPDQVKAVAQLPEGPLHSGPVMDEYGNLYFGIGTQLVRWVPRIP